MVLNRLQDWLEKLKNLKNKKWFLEKINFLKDWFKLAIWTIVFWTSLNLALPQQKAYSEELNEDIKVTDVALNNNSPLVNDTINKTEQISLKEKLDKIFNSIESQLDKNVWNYESISALSLAVRKAMEKWDIPLWVPVSFRNIKWVNDYNSLDIIANDLRNAPKQTFQYLTNEPYMKSIKDWEKIVETLWNNDWIWEWMMTWTGENKKPYTEKELESTKKTRELSKISRLKKMSDLKKAIENWSIAWEVTPDWTIKSDLIKSFLQNYYKVGKKIDELWLWNRETHRLAFMSVWDAVEFNYRKEWSYKEATSSYTSTSISRLAQLLNKDATWIKVEIYNLQFTFADKETLEKAWLWDFSWIPEYALIKQVERIDWLSNLVSKSFNNKEKEKGIEIKEKDLEIKEKDLEIKEKDLEIKEKENSQQEFKNNNRENFNKVFYDVIKYTRSIYEEFIKYNSWDESIKKESVIKIKEYFDKLDFCRQKLDELKKEWFDDKNMDDIYSDIAKARAKYWAIIS